MTPQARICFFTTVQEVDEALIATLPHIPPKQTAIAADFWFEQIVASVNRMRSWTDHAPATDTELPHIALNAVKTLAHFKPFDRTVFNAMLVAKHQLYTATPIIKGGRLMILGKLEMKTERLKSLFQRLLDPATTKADTTLICASIADSLYDIIGYCVLGRCLAQYITAHQG